MPYSKVVVNFINQNIRTLHRQCVSSRYIKLYFKNWCQTYQFVDKKYVSLLKSSFTDDGKNDSWFIFCGKCVEEMFSIYTFLQQALILVLREIAELEIAEWQLTKFSLIVQRRARR